jgi:Tol biopolymer transport system component/DNA-binding winged helix-turn-helix (wHTH) protein
MQQDMGKLTNTAQIWRFGVFEFDAYSMELRRAGVPVKLRDQSSRILAYLLEHAGRMVTREELRQLLWPSDTFVDFDHSLNTAVMTLRDVLGDSADKPLYIETLPKRGYRFVAPVTLGLAPGTQGGLADTSNLPSAADLKGVLSHTSRGEVDAHEPMQDTPRRWSLFRDGAHSSAVSPIGIVAGKAEEKLEQLSNAGGRQSKKWLLSGSVALILAILAVGFLATRVGRERSLPASGSTDASTRSHMRIVPLTSLPGAVGYPAISSDGEKIAFTWNGENPVRSDLYVQLIGGEKPLQLTHTRTGTICCADWSPDGRQIAFGRCYDNGGGVFVVPALGGSERKLTDVVCSFEEGGYPKWTADGNFLVLADRCTPDAPRGIVLLSLATGEKRCLHTPPVGDEGDTEPVLSPDQTTVAFLRHPIIDGVAEIYTVSLSEGMPRQLTHEGENIGGLMWSTDGKRIAFYSNRSGLPRVWRIPATGGVIEPEDVYPATGALSRDGHRLAYLRHGNFSATIWRTDLSGAGGRPVSQQRIMATNSINQGTQLSPDERQIVFESTHSGSGDEIWKSNADGSDVRQLTFLRGKAGTPRWSPDGRWIAFDLQLKGHSQISLMDEEGRNVRSISGGDYENAVPSWSRDGAFLYFASKRTGVWQVWRHELSSGRESQVTRQGGFYASETYDGKTLYYSGLKGGGLWKTPVGGGEEQHVTDIPHRGYGGHFAVTDDGLYLIDSDSEPGPSIVYYDFQTQRSRPVLTLKQDPVAWSSNLAASRNGRILFFAQGESTSSITMVENFQ